MLKFSRTATSSGCLWNFVMTSIFLDHYVSTKIFQKQPFDDVLQNRCSYKFRKIHKKRSMLLRALIFCEFLQWIYCFYCEFLNFFFFPTEHLRTTASETLRVSFLNRRCLMSKFSEILILVCSKRFSVFFNELCPIAVVSPSLDFSLLNWYFMIGNIFVQPWLIWATFHTASDYERFPLLGYYLKNVLIKHFPKMQKQPFAYVL